MQDSEEDDEGLVARLRKEFGCFWFDSKQARVKRDRLKELEARGYLESAKPPYAGGINFRVKPQYEDDEVGI